MSEIFWLVKNIVLKAKSEEYENIKRHILNANISKGVLKKNILIIFSLAKIHIYNILIKLLLSYLIAVSYE